MLQGAISMNIYQQSCPPNGFYVYAYLREDGSPYYIGKGRGTRPTAKHSINKPTLASRIIIIEQNLSELGAHAIERRLIRWYGRKDIGTGILRNKTDGGEGSIGRKDSEEVRRKRGDANRGRKHTVKAKEKMSAWIRSNDLRKKIGDSKRGKDPWNKGITGQIQPAEANASRSFILKNKPTVTCPHCGKTGKGNVMHRYHFTNCKLNA
jgi:hypothetical protein